MEKNIIHFWPNLARAYEISILGEFSLQVIFEKDYKQGFDDYEHIKTFYSKDTFKADGDLVVEIYKPDLEQFGRKQESLHDIHNRVMKARENERPDKFNGPACEALLKTATERLGLACSDTERTNKIAGVIAQLEASKEIKPEHVAEAIQYNVKVMSTSGGYCNAENRYVMFGDGIFIATHELYESDIQNAIKYLSSKLYEI